MVNLEQPPCGCTGWFQGLLDYWPLPTSFPRASQFRQQVRSRILFSRTWIRSNAEKAALRIFTYRYEASCGSLVLYSPVTFPVTSNESPFASKRWAPNSFAYNILAIKASYSTWLLLALNANLRACFIKSPFGPSRMALAPVPYLVRGPIGWKDPSEIIRVRLEVLGWKFYHEVYVYLIFNWSSQFVLYVEFGQLNRPTQHLSCNVGLLQNLTNG